ncbi:MAG: hypothetical protein K2Y05_09945 [Hyphomicrobiaceae bacterium]|nr:hypothetical protein [Hyphomicrobiaceae bacterium]
MLDPTPEVGYKGLNANEEYRPSTAAVSPQPRIEMDLDSVKKDSWSPWMKAGMLTCFATAVVILLAAMWGPGAGKSGIGAAANGPVSLQITTELHRI